MCQSNNLGSNNNNNNNNKKKKISKSTATTTTTTTTTTCRSENIAKKKNPDQNMMASSIVQMVCLVFFTDLSEIFNYIINMILSIIYMMMMMNPNVSAQTCVWCSRCVKIDAKKKIRKNLILGFDDDRKERYSWMNEWMKIWIKFFFCYFDGRPFHFFFCSPSSSSWWWWWSKHSFIC